MNAANHKNIQIGMNIRFPPFCSHTIGEEIGFARSAGFDCVQFAVREPGDYAAGLGISLDTLGRVLQEANLLSVMEIVIRIDETGHNFLGQTPLEVRATWTFHAFVATCFNRAFPALRSWKLADCHIREGMGRTPMKPCLTHVNGWLLL